MGNVSFFWGLLIICSAAAAVGILAVIFSSWRYSKADKALRLRNRAVESSVNAVVIAAYSGAHSPIEYVNPAFERITGYTAKEVLGQGIHFLFSGEDGESSAEVVRSAISEQREHKATIPCRRKDGGVVWADLQIAPVKDDKGSKTHFIAVLNESMGTDLKSVPIV